MTEGKNNFFRPEIQGLRAIAVLAVIFFHVNPQIITGGYVGVDVFFVISGYLMTGLLLREFLQTGTISLKTFYARRIRRLLPASTVVLALAALSVSLLPTVYWPNTAKEILTSSFYTQNWWLALQSVDYMASENAPTLLMHYWSLAIEEQYYIFWPLLFLAVILLFKTLRKHPRFIFGAVIAIICLASFIYGAYLTPKNPALAYFITLTRIWELALGGLLVVLTPQLKLIPVWLKRFCGWLGLIMILVACGKFSGATLFPGYAALLPTLGAVGVIIGGEVADSRSVRHFLGYRPLRYIGDISYSLYLWHWSVIILYAYSGIPKGTSLHVSDIAIMLATTFILAVLSKKFVEDPFRRKREGSFLNAFALLFLSLAISLMAANYVWLKYNRHLSLHPPVSFAAGNDDFLAQTLTLPYDPTQPLIPALDIANLDRSELYDKGHDTSFTKSNVLPYSVGAGELALYQIVLVGDSHAAQWAPALERLVENNPDMALTVYTKSSCPFADVLLDTPRGKSFANVCIEWYNGVMREIKTLQPDIIFTSASRSHKAAGAQSTAENTAMMAAAYQKTWNELTERGIKVVVIIDTPWLEFNVRDCLSASGANIKKCTSARAMAFKDPDPLLTAMANNTNPDVIFMDFSDTLCDKNECVPVYGQVLLWRDAHHLTRTYVRLLAPRFALIMRNELALNVK